MLSLLLLSIAIGHAIFRFVRSGSLLAVAIVAAPYLAYVTTRAVLDSLAAAEPAFAWVSYQPAYFIWPHFVAVPVGLSAGARKRAVRRRGQLCTIGNSPGVHL